MIALLDNGQDLDECAGELGCEVGQLLTPLTRYRLRDASKPWAIDNGAFAKFEREAFVSLLEREEHHKERCLFVSAPDVVGSARRTLEVFERWKPKLEGWKLALVCQDGQEHLRSHGITLRRCSSADRRTGKHPYMPRCQTPSGTAPFAS